MTCPSNQTTTPGGNQSTHRQSRMATGQSDSGEPGLRQESVSERSGKFPKKMYTFFGTLNIQTLIQVGKLHTLTAELKKQKITLMALQETRFTDSETMEYNGYRIFKSGTNRKVGKGAPLFGMAFAVDKDVLGSIIDVTPINNRLMTLRLRHTNKTYTIINAHAPTNIDNKKKPEEVEKYWEILERTMSKIPQKDVKILLGDFNAQIGRERKYRSIAGKHSAHHNTNKNGERLIDICRQFGLKIMSTALLKKPSKKKTWRSPINRIGEYQIDHVAITYDYQREIQDIQVRKGANIESDHYLTRIRVGMKPKRKHTRKPPISKFDLRKLKESNLPEEWEKIPAENWKEFKLKIIGKAKEIIPLTKKPKHPWWNEKCEGALEIRKKAFLDYNSHSTETTHQKFLEIRRECNKIIRQNKRRYINDQLKSIEENFRNYNTHDFYKTFANQIKGYQPQNLSFRKSDGKLALTNEDNCRELARYFNTLLNCPTPNERFPLKSPETPTPCTTMPDTDEITKHIGKLKNNRASGEDGIVAELLKNLGKNSRQELIRIIQTIWETEEIPEDWKMALIHPLHKKGDRKDINNYRGISLLSVPYKILSSCLLKRVQEQIEHKIADYQAGFRPNRSCPEQILNLKQTLKIQALRNKPTVCTFVDFKKAYDSIDRTSLDNILHEYGLDDKTRRLIKETLTDTKSKVKFMGTISEPFTIDTGVRQGDGLSPLLFNIVLDKVMKEWEIKLKEENNWKPITLGGKNKIVIPYLAFADDLAIITNNPCEATTQIETLKECAEKVGLQISFEKTEFFATQTTINILNTKYGKINRVKHFKYLGEVIQPTGLEKLSQETRLQKVKKSLGLIHNLYNKKSISINTKIRHYNTVLKPAILYGSETLSLQNKNCLENIKKEERKIIRKILGPRKTDEGYRLQKIETTEKHSNIELDIRKRRAKFYGHISRLSETRLTKRLFNYTNGLKQTTDWTKHTRKDLENAKITSEDTQDRNVFRNKVNKWEPVPEQRPKRHLPKWSEERKQEHSLRMKNYWLDKKNKKC